MSGSTRRQHGRSGHDQQPGCVALAPTLDLWISGELPARDEPRVRKHLAACPGCTLEVASLRCERAAFARRAELDRTRPPAFAAVLSRARVGDTAGPPVLHASVSRLPAARRDRSMLALGLCAAAALFCVLLPRRDAVMVRPEPDAPSSRAAQTDPRPPREARTPALAVVESAEAMRESSDSCSPVASFDDSPPARAGAAPIVDPTGRDDDARVCAEVVWSGLSPSGRDDGAPMCGGPTEL